MITKTQADPLFAAKLTPYRSLSSRGQTVLIGVIAAMAAIPSMVFYSLGAWPIVGFMGLDVLGMWLALRWSNRQTRRFEEVTLWPNRLEVREVSPGGKQTTTAFDPHRTRLIVDRDYDEKTLALYLRNDGGDYELGSFLAASEKASFAKVFGTALRRARR
ncbi:DUF2244 domain-containing protein [Devosia sp. D6-9]|nr:DUF2244 domain-containing protein [Devosia sp. D6-9]